MPQIVTNTYFINDLMIPQAQDTPSIGDGLPTAIDELNDACVVIEKDLLLNAFGLDIYNDIQTALADIDNADQKWKDLINGVEYDGKIWDGLKNPKTFIAYAVYYKYLNMESDYWTTFGTVKAESVNAINTTPFYKLTSAWNKFLEKYQKGNMICPDYYSGIGWQFTDYYGNHTDVNVSLYQYMRDKSEDYGWSADLFKVYESVNTFGI